MAKAKKNEALEEGAEQVGEAVALPHLAKCPAERQESYQAKNPKGEEVTVTRCIDCGAYIANTQVLGDVLEEEGGEEEEEEVVA